MVARRNFKTMFREKENLVLLLRKPYFTRNYNESIIRNSDSRRISQRQGVRTASLSFAHDQTRSLGI